jgi:hypothetical protein
MRTGRPLQALSVSEHDRTVLKRWERRPKTAQGLALRARIVLACADGLANKIVAKPFGITGRPSASGAEGSSNAASMACSTSPGLAPLDSSATRMSKRS